MRLYLDLDLDSACRNKLLWQGKMSSLIIINYSLRLAQFNYLYTYLTLAYWHRVNITCQESWHFTGQANYMWVGQCNSMWVWHGRECCLAGWQQHFSICYIKYIFLSNQTSSILTPFHDDMKPYTHLDWMGWASNLM